MVVAMEKFGFQVLKIHSEWSGAVDKEFGLKVFLS